MPPRGLPDEVKLRISAEISDALAKFEATERQWNEAVRRMGKEGATAFTRLDKQAHEYVEEMRKLATVTKGTGREQRKLWKDAVTGLDLVEPKIRRVEKELKKVGTTGKKTTKQVTEGVNRLDKALGRAANAVKLLVAGFVTRELARFAREAVSTAAAFESMDQTMLAVFETSEKAAEEFAFVKDTVILLGLDLRRTARDYAKLAAATKGTAVEGAIMKELFLGASAAGRTLGLSGERMSAIFVALEQIMSRGTVAAEELRRQLGNQLPGAFKLAADATGLTLKQFDKLLRTGKVAAETFLPQFAKALTGKYWDTGVAAGKKLAAQLERTSTAVQLLQVSFAEGLKPAVEEFSKQMLDAADSKSALSVFVERLGKFTGFLAEWGLAAGSSAGLFIKSWEGVKKAFTDAIDEMIFGGEDFQFAITKVAKETSELKWFESFDPATGLFTMAKKVVDELGTGIVHLGFALGDTELDWKSLGLTSDVALDKMMVGVQRYARAVEEGRGETELWGNVTEEAAELIVKQTRKILSEYNALTPVMREPFEVSINLVKQLSARYEDFIERIKESRKELKLTSEQLKAIGEETAKFKEQMGPATEGLDELQQNAGNAAENLAEAKAELERLQTLDAEFPFLMTPEQVHQMDSMPALIRSAEQKVRDLELAFQDYDEQLFKHQAQQELTNQLAADFRRRLEEQALAQSILGESLERYSANAESAKTNTENLSTAFGDQKTKVEPLAEATHSLADALDDIKNSGSVAKIEELTNTFKRMEGVLKNAETAADSLGNVMLGKFTDALTLCNQLNRCLKEMGGVQL